MASLSNANRPDIRAYIGATGSGKGVSIRAHLRQARPARLLVWDPLAEYADFARAVHALPELVRAVAKAGAGRVAIAYTPRPGTDYRAAFELFCALAFRLGACTVLVEELGEVTSPSWAPLSWRKLTTQGRHAGLSIIAASQRPAQVDKNFLGGCTYIRCFTLRYPQDRAAMAGAMDVPLARIAELATVEDDKGAVMTYIERDFRAGWTKTHTERIKRRA